MKAPPTTAQKKQIPSSMIKVIVTASAICFQFVYSITAYGSELLPENQIKSIEAIRHPNNPLITFDSSPKIGKNINGPSVIKVPQWIENPLGKYYMYFGHHKGKFIRLAYADQLEGPWSIHEPGTLQAKAFQMHIASPDVHIDQENKRIIMYFHSHVKTKIKEEKGQKTGIAFSNNGIDFKSSDDILGKFYFRVWKRNNEWYALAKNNNTGWGELYRSENGVSGFNCRGNFLQSVRHTAVLTIKDQLIVFYSRKGDCPERIVAATIDMKPSWLKWEASEICDVIKPEMEYEGIQYELKPSAYGSSIKVQQLRDPCIYEEDGKIYLFYSTAGEMGIAMAVLKIEMKKEK